VKRFAKGRPRRLLTATAAVVVVAVALSACSKSSSSSGGGNSSPVSGAGSSTATKSAFTFAWFDNNLTGNDNQAGIVAAVKAINAAGGVDGHPLQYQACIENNDVNQATACAQKGISNSSVLSFVDVGSSYGNAFVPLMVKAGIANLGDLPSTAADNTSPITFPLYGGGFNTIVAAVADANLLHETRIGVPYIGVPAGAQLSPFIGLMVKGKATVVGSESIPPTATDYTSYAATEIAAKPGMVVDGLTADMYTKFIQAVRQQGDSNMKFQISAGVFDAAQVKSLFPGDNNIYLVNEFDHSAPGYQHFLSDVNTYNPSYSNRNDSVLSGWIGVEAFAQILKALIAEGKTNPTRADIVSYLNKQTDFDVQGLTDGINFTKPNPTLGGSIRRIFNDRVWLAKAVNGTEQPLNGGKPFSLYLNSTGASSSASS
jgi:ABC-type branched-subunit amino acid transport system substrate-binding protein